VRLRLSERRLPPAQSVLGGCSKGAAEAPFDSLATSRLDPAPIGRVGLIVRAAGPSRPRLSSSRPSPRPPGAPSTTR